METNILEVNSIVLKAAGFCGVYEMVSYEYENIHGCFGLTEEWGVNSDNINADDINKIGTIHKWVESSKRTGEYQNVSCQLILIDKSVITWYVSFYLD